MQTSNLFSSNPENMQRENYETISPFPLSLPLSRSAWATGLVTERRPNVNQDDSKQRRLC